MTSILLFNTTLRLHDNPALAAAVARGAPIIPVYILDDEAAGEWALGGASRWWLHYSLISLSAALEKRGAALILKRGNADKILDALITHTRASHLYLNHAHEPWLMALETRLKNNSRIKVEHFVGATLLDSETCRTQSGGVFKVFTPFWNSARALVPSTPPLSTPSSIPFESAHRGLSERLDEWNLLPTSPNWAKGIATRFVPGEEAAHKRAEFFLEQQLFAYADKRDVPSAEVTSELSPYLHFGEISARSVFHRVRTYVEAHPAFSAAGEKFLSELGWREFSYYLLTHFPALPTQPFRPEFVHFPWGENEKFLRAWQKGKTGFPIIDAGMRELWQTGFMHNRVRMIVASFLTKHLHIHWREGAKWFWDTLVDADLANNSASWQWVAGCGVDAAPFFRIFNPILQGQKFDREGTYIKKYVPELAALSPAEIHTPWKNPLLTSAYPAPIIDLDNERKNALAALKRLKA